MGSAVRVSLHLLMFVSTDSNTETVQLPPLVTDAAQKNSDLLSFGHG